MKYLRYAWHILVGLINLGIVIAVLSVPTTKFETLVLAGLVELYATVLYNFSALAMTAHVNNYAAFVRFRTLAKAQGVIESEDGNFEEQETSLKDALEKSTTPTVISQLANAAVSLYALFKIVQAVFFA